VRRLRRAPGAQHIGSSVSDVTDEQCGDNATAGTGSGGRGSGRGGRSGASMGGNHYTQQQQE
jgi:hypothetical protein